MIQERAVTALWQRLGWKQPTIADYNIVDADNLKSDSGKYFDDFSSLSTVRNVKDTQENPAISNADFNIYLKAMQEKSIRFVLESVLDSKVYENTSLLRYDNGNSEVYTLSPDTFYGIQIDLNKNRKVALDIKQIGLFFDDDNAAFNLHLFHSSKLAPVKTWSTVTTSEKTEVFTDISETIYAFSQSIKGGKYFLGFRSEDVTGSPINRQESIKQSCFVDIEFIRVPMTSLQMFNTDDVIRTSEQYLNMDYSIEVDYTELIISNKASFDHAIGLQQVASVLDQIANTTRSNVTERNLGDLRVEAHLELYGNDVNQNLPFKPGIASKLNKELARLKRQFNPLCRASVGTLTV